MPFRVSRQTDPPGPHHESTDAMSTQRPNFPRQLTMLRSSSVPRTPTWLVTRIYGSPQQGGVTPVVGVTLPPDEDPFQDDEEDDGIIVRGGRMYPSWAFDAVPSYKPTPLGQLSTGFTQGSALKPSTGLSQGSALMNSPFVAGYEKCVVTPGPVRRAATQALTQVQSLAQTSCVVPKQTSAEVDGNLQVPRPVSGVSAIISRVPAGSSWSCNHSSNFIEYAKSYFHTPSAPTPCQDENILTLILDQDASDPLYEETCANSGGGAEEEPPPPSRRSRRKMPHLNPKAMLTLQTPLPT